MTILLADDSDDDVLLIQLAFKAAQIPPSTQLQVVRSGEEAIAYVKGEGKYADRADHPRPSLLLLDLIMPGTDGFDVLRSLRSEPKLRRLRVIVLTTSADPAKAGEAYRLGANAFLVKPGSFEGMIDLAKSILSECHHAHHADALPKRALDSKTSQLPEP